MLTMPTTTTDEEAAFLRAIASSPEDDTPRLVYADWLDETAADPVPCERCGGGGKIGVVWGEYGETRPRHDCPACSGEGSVTGPGPRQDRAEFIRGQVELARVGPCRFRVVNDTGHTTGFACGDKFGMGQIERCCPDCRITVPLRARQSALLTARGREWSQPVMAALGVDGCHMHKEYAAEGWLSPFRLANQNVLPPSTGWRFARGFVAEVRVPTLAEVVGDRDCPRCEGRGGNPLVARGGLNTGPLLYRSGRERADCGHCSGLGRSRACGCVAGYVYEGQVQPDGTATLGGHVCQRCNGTQVVAPLAPRLAGLPVERVWCGDRVPDSIDDTKGSWYTHASDDFEGDPSYLPNAVYDLLEGGEEESEGEWTWRIYPARGLASAALAEAVATYIRRHHDTV